MARKITLAKRSIKRIEGSTLAEFAPAFFILLVGLFFPMLDLMALSTVYSVGASMNDEQLREAALLKRSQAQDVLGSVMYTIPNAWKNSGLGRYAKIDSDIITSVSYADGPQDQYGNVEKLVCVSTSFSVKPFLSVPIPISVPGLNADITFNFNSRRVLEYPPNANQ
ncbi:MAG: hypothetical protein C5B53_03495 [Candidatus Melainabacteria bacterium]|nr:MAG: hypothetical protein C5B53_03495 [Candidatus Melainabacteria bacterium]